MKKMLIVMAILVASSVSYAEEKAKIIDKKLILVSAYTVGMTIFDVETTFRVIHEGGEEKNPLMRPFTKNRLYMYGVQLTVDAAFLYLAYEMKGSKNKEFRRLWWVSPMLLGTAHGVAGGLNLRYCW